MLLNSSYQIWSVWRSVAACFYFAFFFGGPQITRAQGGSSHIYLSIWFCFLLLYWANGASLNDIDEYFLRVYAGSTDGFSREVLVRPLFLRRRLRGQRGSICLHRSLGVLW
ncbi:hypothetical protein P153DRAFT_121861 [Dothidotthia symphoricarpi CBS 119687]|uniref:Uncharacterized protein n=1 Tax=Dothidotthia symphoricarpi CBS 119687 TaxID=1392245 RepID=A0A6A6A1W1_9PLEO|nr:uncharacterized protein P153DRAFT_121861 [Dothidotthia symphoricarpi CBS 119687]KAF2125164.1 hypothetical protein P153DRAFT_121861 [Dothidotthia symphoricarpi CBS 119687]